MTYSDKLKDPRWQKKRLEVLNRDKFRCQLCGDEKETLHVHHISYYRNPWDASLPNLITLCAHCHLVTELYNQDRKYKLLGVTKFSFSTSVIISTLVNVEGIGEEFIAVYEYDKKERDIKYLTMITKDHLNSMVYLFQNLDASKTTK